MIQEKPGKKITKEITVDDELKIYDVLIQIYCMLENIPMSGSERDLLKYYIKWDITKETEALFIKEYLCNKQRLFNLKHALSKKELINKNEGLGIWEVVPQLRRNKNNNCSTTLTLEFNVAK